MNMMDITRKEFLVGSTTFAGALAMPSIASSTKKSINVALIGCGGRGNGTLKNILDASKIVGIDVNITALCDWFEDNAVKTRDKFNLVGTKLYIGPTAYKDVMADKSIDAVLLVTPIGFRPIHFKAAVDAGKHVFEEKAVAVDGPGVRMHIEAARESVKKHLTVVAGTQRRHSKQYRMQARAIEAGIIAPICSGIIRWNGRARYVYMRDILKDVSNKDYLIKNWNNFDILAGDHIVEQHVHNIDIANWFIGRYPKKAVSFGMRARALTGNQYDFFSTELDYGDDVFIHSQCRQINGCYDGVGEWFRTENNEILTVPYSITKKGKSIDISKFGEGLLDCSPYVAEHVDFLNSIFGVGPYWNEGEQVAMSTACGIMSNMSAKTGQAVFLDDLLTNVNSRFYNWQFTPTAADFEKDGDLDMPEYGENEYMVPGDASLPRPRNPDDDEWMPPPPRPTAKA